MKDIDLLEPSEYEIAKSLFNDFSINKPMIHTTLEKRDGGLILTDRANPSFALAYNPACYTFLAGSLDSNALQKVARYLKAMPKVSLGCPIDWEYREFFQKEGFTPVERMQFRRPQNLELSRDWKLPYRISKIDKDSFSRCQWYEFVCQFYGSEEQFLSQGMGYCILGREGKVLSESYGLISNTMAEIIVITDPDHQGKGLGTIACAHVLDECKGLEMIWSCDRSNPASAGIAKKLGFEEDFPYLFLKWSNQM